MSSLETELARLQAELDASRRELEVARAEVIRLRNLLGLNRPVPEGPSDGRLFAPEPLPSAVEVVQGPITRGVVPGGEVGIVSPPVRSEDRRVRGAVGEPLVGQGGVDAGSQRRAGWSAALVERRRVAGPSRGT